MKPILFVIGMIFLGLGALATPIAIIYGLHEWVVVDVQFKFALWEACKVWMSMLFLLVPGGLLFVAGQ